MDTLDQLNHMMVVKFNAEKIPDTPETRLAFFEGLIEELERDPEDVPEDWLPTAKRERLRLFVKVNR